MNNWIIWWCHSRALTGFAIMVGEPLCHALSNMVTVHICSKLKTSWKLVVFTNTVGKNCQYFVGVFNKAIIIPLVLVGYEMIIANWALRASLAIYHLIFNAHLWNNCLSAPNPSICFLLVDFHIFQELIFKKNFQKFWILFFYKC